MGQTGSREPAVSVDSGPVVEPQAVPGGLELCRRILHHPTNEDMRAEVQGFAQIHNVDRKNPEMRQIAEQIVGGTYLARSVIYGWNNLFDNAAPEIVQEEYDELLKYFTARNTKKMQALEASRHAGQTEYYANLLIKTTDEKKAS